MHIALFVCYAVICCYGILKLPVFRRSGIRPAVLVILFALHVAVGCIHNVIAWRYYPGHGDIWDSFQWGLRFRNWLGSDFQHFLQANSRWTYFTHNGIMFIHLLLNFLSFDNIYINTLLFAFPVFIGNLSLYRVFRRHFPADPLTAILVFLLPSTLFWTACVFREGVLYMLLGFYFDRLDSLRLSRGARSGRGIVLLCGCVLLILYFRFIVGVFLLPAALTRYWIERRGRKLLLRALGAIAIIGIALLLAFPQIAAGALRGLGHWQSQFQDLEGHSRLYLPTLDGSWASLFRTMPYAFLNGLFQPLPGSGGRPIYLAFSVELVLIWIVVAIALGRALLSLTRVRAQMPGASMPADRSDLSRAGSPLPPANGFAAASLVFAFLGMMVIGAMVPFAGAIVRYRSIYLPFLLAPALHSLRALSPLRQLNQWLSNRL